MTLQTYPCYPSLTSHWMCPRRGVNSGKAVSFVMQCLEKDPAGATSASSVSSRWRNQRLGPQGVSGWEAIVPIPRGLRLCMVGLLTPTTSVTSVTAIFFFAHFAIAALSVYPVIYTFSWIFASVSHGNISSLRVGTPQCVFVF